MKRIDLTGQRFGRLTVIRYDHSEHDGASGRTADRYGRENEL